jgi:hypothetical protein
VSHFMLAKIGNPCPRGGLQKGLGGVVHVEGPFVIPRSFPPLRAMLPPRPLPCGPLRPGRWCE